MQTGLMDRGRALPTGTVTFLLTDVEASTRLWSERTADMPDAIARHYELLDQAIAEHGGVRPVEQGEGDSVVAAFAHAADAVAAALAAQQSLALELPWLRVRIAVHTGEAILRDEGNYVGLGIIRCARLRGCGHGGQVLVSETTAPLVEQSLPAGASLVALGAVRLRDLQAREAVFQLVHAGLPSTFPPLRALEAPPNNLPAPLTSLVGRAVERSEVMALLRTERLVTLTGAGGAGKTRLALDVARVVADDRPGGCWWLELAPLTDDAQPAEVFAQLLGVDLPTGARAESVLASHLRSLGPTLLVLDNAEHLVGAVASFVEHLLSACADLVVVVTSREPLGVPGEVVWRVPSLACPPADAAAADVATFDAAALFLDRARRARPNLALDDTAAGHIGTICRRCDGLPLAIELAAARCRSLPLHRIAAGLDDAFTLLTGGARTALPRQQTLLASIAWSADLLDPAEATVFHRLATFQGAFTLDAAEAVAADGAVIDGFAVFELLTRLVDKSLIHFDTDAGRYRMLETVRQYAVEQLRTAHDLAATRQRHAEWMAEWCRQAGQGQRGLSLLALAEDTPDVVAALEWSYQRSPATAYAIAGTFGALLGLLGPTAVNRLIDWVLAQDPDDQPAAWAAAVAGCSYRIIYTDRHDLVARLGDAAERLDPGDIASATALQAFAHMEQAMRGDLTWTVAMLADCEAAGNVLGLVNTAGAQSFILIRQGLVADTDVALGKALMALEREGIPACVDTMGFGYTTLIDRHLYTADLVHARSLVDLSIGEPEALHSAAVELAHLAWATADDALMAESRRWMTAEAGPRQLSLRAIGTGFAAWADGDAAGACASFADGLRGLRFTGVLNGLFPTVHVAARLASGDVDGAQAAADDWRAFAAELGDKPLHLAAAHHALALVGLAQDRLDAAADDAHAALTVAHEHGLTLLVLDALTLLAQITDRRQPGPVAARVAAAAHAARRRAGYLRPLVADPASADALAAQLRREHPDAYAEGAALALDDAVAYVRRSRGQRARPVSGWAALTPTEHLVADLVANGRSNAEIASQLLMSVPTVKTHLTRVFAKVGVRNRTELAARERAR